MQFNRTALFLAFGFCFTAPALAAKPVEPVAGPARGFADNQLTPLSLSMMARADTLLAAGQIQPAIDYYEASLAADPRNRRAYVGLARAAEAQELPGKAASYYREALEIDPDDLDVLELQGLIFTKRGAKARAESNVERMRTLCTKDCAQVSRLTAAIAAMPAAPTPTSAEAAAANTETKAETAPVDTVEE